MFQLEKRVNSITVNDAEREEFNELLIQAQELTGMVHTRHQRFIQAAACGIDCTVQSN